MSNAKEKEWPEQRIAKLKELWPDKSLSTAEIGRRLGVSKSAAIGKAHRLDLPGRESPIKPRRHGKTPEPTRRAGVTTLPPLPSLS